MARTPAAAKNAALEATAREIRRNASAILAANQGDVARATDAGRGTAGVFRLGFEDPGIADLAADRPASYRARHPGAEVQVREADFRDPFGMLRAGDVDALVTPLPVKEPDLTTGPVVWREPMALAVSARHPFARQDTVTLDDLSPTTRCSEPPARRRRTGWNRRGAGPRPRGIRSAAGECRRPSRNCSP
jgi:DNA-binding transcriptional LysR family regulator